ncbi:MAG: Gfo/Idh/MocA family oxidoreductase [Clostridia bacterium]|nr:Gfo/Idh/MocA family oxidoreductase [Clostridia bacterium]
MEQVRYGIIGYGKIGSQHVKKILEGKVPSLKLCAIADTDPARIEAAKAALGDSVQYFDSAEALIASGAVDAVHICTPHYQHPTLAIQALNAGLHTLVEKPAGVYTKQVKAMNEVAKAHPELRFAMDFNQRTDPVYVKAREMVKSGQLGEIVHTHWLITNWYRSQSYYDQGGWRATWKGEGGGVLLNQNPHNLDMWQWIVGMPSRVKAQVYYGRHRNIEVEDDVIAMAEFPNGAIGTYITTVIDAPGTNRLEIDGTLGRMVVENGGIHLDLLEMPEPEFNASWTKGLGKPKMTSQEIKPEGEYTAHPGIMENFCQSILTGAPLYADGLEGINGLEISNAIHLSDWTGGGWVGLPVDEELFCNLLREKCGGKLPEVR